MPDAPGLELILAEINREHPEAVLDTSFDREQAALIIDPSKVIEVLTWLKETPGQEYTFLSSVHGADYFPRSPRFAVHYELLNRERYERLRVKAVIQDPAVGAEPVGDAPGRLPAGPGVPGTPPTDSTSGNGDEEHQASEAGVVGGPDGTPGEVRPAEPPTASAPTDGLTLGTYRDLWANSTTDLSPALSYLIPAQRLEVSVADAERLGLSKGDEVAVKSGDTEITAFVAIRAALPEGTCFLMEGTQQGNANVFKNNDLGKPAVVEIGKATPALEVVAGNGNGGE